MVKNLSVTICLPPGGLYPSYSPAKCHLAHFKVCSNTGLWFKGVLPGIANCLLQLLFISGFRHVVWGRVVGTEMIARYLVMLLVCYKWVSVS